MSDIATKVDSGIQLLNDHYGDESWMEKIDLETLDLGSCGVCVLGQLFGDYDTGLTELGIDYGKTYGFDLSSASGTTFSALTAAWKDALGKNSVLVEKGDVYYSKSGYGVEVVSTQLVLTTSGKNITLYICTTGLVKGGTFEPDFNNEYILLKKGSFEEGGGFPKKLSKFSIKKGMFFETADGKKYFAYNSNEIRELKSGAYAVRPDTVNLDGAKEMMTGMYVPFGDSIKRHFEEN